MQVEKNALLVRPARRFVASAQPAFPERRRKQAPPVALVVLRSGLPGWPVADRTAKRLAWPAVPAIPGATPSHLESPARPSLAGR